MRFCKGSPRCDVCGAWHVKGDLQKCPSPIRTRQHYTPTSKGLLECQHLGEPTGGYVPVVGCGGCKSAKASTAVFACDLYGECTPLGRSELVFCQRCSDFS